ncbi:MAG: glutamine amidotransferase, partial [Planctomycetales bacterium]
DPISALPGQPPEMKVVDTPRTLRPARNQELLPVEFKFVAQNPGEYKLTLEVIPLDGEPLIINNALTTYFTVLKGGISVAYFDREHRAEMKFIRRLDESPDVRLDLKPIRLGPLGATPPIESDWFDPGRYDVYIIGSVPARVFGPAVLDKLARAVEQGAGLMMTGGTLSFGPGGYGGTSLEVVLPVRMLRTEIQNGDIPDRTLHYDQKLQMLPTPQGLQHFVMRLDSPENNLARWQALPPLDGANRFTGLKDGALTLAVSAENFPLLVAQDYGKGRTIAFAADSTYHWYMERPIPEEHQRFWMQTILWLAHKDQQGDESVWVKLDGRRFRVGQPVSMTFGARDADKRPIDDAEFKIEVTGPGGRRMSVTGQRSGTDHLARFLETQTAGEYRVHVEAHQKGQSIGLPAEARFVVFEQDLELHNPAADSALMEEISRITGGVAVPPEELGAHLRRLAQQGLHREVTEIRRISLWDNWPVLLLFVLALSAEWYIRKRRGLV